MAIWLPERDVWTRQPIERPVVAVNSGLTSGIDHVFLPSISRMDAVTGEKWVAFGSPSITTSEKGIVANSTASGGGYYLQTAKNVATSQQSFMAVIDYDSFVSDTTYLGWFCSANASGSQNSFSLQANFGTWHIWNGSTVASLGIFHTVNQPWLVCVMIGGTGGSAVYWDGVLKASGSGLPAAKADSRLVLHGERSASATYSIKARTAVLAHWTRKLAVGEVLALSKNPWQIFE